MHDQHQIVRQEGPVSIQLQIQSDKSRGATSHPLKIHQKGIERQSELQFVHIASSISNHIYTFFTFITGTFLGEKDLTRANRKRTKRGILWPYGHKVQGTGTRRLISTALPHGKVFLAWPTDGNSTTAKLKDLTEDLTRY